MVVFNVSEVVVRESQENKVHAKFVIIRRGSDLSFPTTVSFRALSLPSDTATPGLDYAPFSGVCGVGAECVTFRSGDTTIVRTVTIFPDRTREGNETLHVNITDVIGGWRGRPGLLRVVIEDGTSCEFAHLCAVVLCADVPFFFLPSLPSSISPPPLPPSSDSGGFY